MTVVELVSATLFLIFVPMVDVSDVDIPKYDTNAFDVFTAEMVAVLDVTPLRSIVPRWIEAMSVDLNSTTVHMVVVLVPAPLPFLSAVIVIESVREALTFALGDVVFSIVRPP